MPTAAGEQTADQEDQAARAVIVDAGLLRGLSRRMIEHRHAKQLGRRDESGEGRQPEVKPQRREDDEDKVDERPDEAERRIRAHTVDLQRQRKCRHRRLDEGADIAPDHRQIAALPHMPGDRRMHPHLEQDERRDGGVEIEWIEIAVPDPAHRVGREEEDTPGDEQEQHGCPDQRLDADQLAAQHLLHERALEIGGDRRSLLASSAPPTSHWFPSSFRGASKRRTMGRPCAPENLEIPGSRFACSGMTL